METKFGTTPQELGLRDCIHVPCISCYADTTVSPGDRVIFIGNNKVRLAHSHEDYHGIVDPFRTLNIGMNVWFYVLAKPNTVNNIRHVFELESDKNFVQQDSNVTKLQSKIDELESELQYTKDKLAIVNDEYDSHDECRYCY